MNLIYGKGWHENLLQGLGLQRRAANRLAPWLATERRRLSRRGRRGLMSPSEARVASLPPSPPPSSRTAHPRGGASSRHHAKS
jgi:hypothetical protein